MPISEDSLEGLIGQALDDLVLESVLGIGGQAVVLLARGQHLGQHSAVKLFGLSDDFNSDSIGSGLDEARKQARVHHGSVVQVFEPGLAALDFEGKPKNVLYVPMAYASDGNCQGSPPFTTEAFSLSDLRELIDLLDGLVAIHTAGLIHGDIKPANILRFPERRLGRTRTVLKFSDFGMAQVMTAMGNAAAGLTPQYMAPEALDGPLTPLSDVYSLGATLFQMLTGQMPFDLQYAATGLSEGGVTKQLFPERLRAWQKAHERELRPDVCTLNRSCPARLALLVMQMMGPDVGDRPDLGKCVSVLESIELALKGRLHGFPVPPELKEQLQAGRLPIVHHVSDPPFFPEVYAACGKYLALVRMTLLPQDMSQYQRLVTLLAKHYSDCFSLQEIYGPYDVHLELWSTREQLAALAVDLQRDFRNNEILISTAASIDRIDGPPRRTTSMPTPVVALSIQEGIILRTADNLLDYRTATVPRLEGEVGAFVYVKTIGRAPSALELSGLASELKLELAEVVKNGRFRTMALLHTTSQSHLQFVESQLVVRCTTMDYRNLCDLTTCVGKASAGRATTETCIETTRVSILSHKLFVI